MKRYWESLPGFRHERQAKLVVQLILEYFDEPAEVEEVASEDFPDISWWHVRVNHADETKLLLMESFIVGWGKGYEQGSIDERVGTLAKLEKREPS